MPMTIATRYRLASLWPTGLLILLTLSTYITKTIFESSELSKKDLERLRILLGPEEIDSVSKINLKNEQGELAFERKLDEGLGPWMMSSPRTLPANNQAIDKILKALKNISIRKFFTKEEANLKNYSLDRPVFTLHLVQSSGEEITIHVGLENPIDNSTYIYIPERKTVYNVDSFNLSSNIDNAKQEEWIDHHLFLHDISSVQAIKFYQGAQGAFEEKLKLSIRKQDGQWQGQSGHSYSDDEIKKKLAPLFLITANKLLDKITPESQTIIDKALKSPLLTIEIEDDFGRTTSYAVTSPITQKIEELNGLQSSFTIVRADGKNFAYVLSDEQQSLIKIPQLEAKGQFLKKIFTPRP